MPEVASKQDRPWSYDVSRQYVGNVYARALLRVTEKRGTSESVIEELAGVVELLGQLSAWRAILASPRVPLDQKLGMLDKALGGRINHDLLCFLKVTARRGRIDCLPEILAAARQQWDQLRGIQKVVVDVAAPLRAEEQERLKQQLEQLLGVQVRLEYRVRPELVGGLVVHVGDTVYDASVLNQLERWKQSVVARMRQEMRQQMARFAE